MSLRRRLPVYSRIDRYVASHFVWSYMAALGLLTGLFLLIDMATNLDDWVEPWKDGTRVAARSLLTYYAFNLPYLFLQMAPFVTLIAGMFTVNRLLRTNEVTAVLGAGISAHRLLLPIYAGSVFLAGGMFAVREGLGHGIADRRDALLDMLEEQRMERVYENIVVRDLSGSLVILERFHPEPPSGAPYVEGLSVRLRRDGRYMRIEAPRAEWSGDRLILEDGHRMALREGGEEEVAQVEELTDFAITPDVALTYRRARDNPLELSFSEVQMLIKREPDHPAWITLWHYHLTFPLANLVLVLVGIPAMFTYERGAGADRMALGGLLCVFYFAIDFVMRSLGLTGGLSPVLASWLPVLIFGSLGVVLTDSMRS